MECGNKHTVRMLFLRSLILNQSLVRDWDSLWSFLWLLIVSPSFCFLSPKQPLCHQQVAQTPPCCLYPYIWQLSFAPHLTYTLRPWCCQLAVDPMFYPPPPFSVTGERGYWWQASRLSLWELVKCQSQQMQAVQLCFLGKRFDRASYNESW